MIRTCQFCACLLLLGQNGWTQNLLQNGGFETAPAQDSGNNTGQGYYTQSIADGQILNLNNWNFGKIDNGTDGDPRVHWYTTGNRPDWAPAVNEGSFAVQLNSDNSTALLYVEQAVSTTLIAGRTYQFSFQLSDETGAAGAQGGSAVSGFVQFGTGTGTGFSSLSSDAVPNPADADGSQGWRTVFTTFTPSITQSYTVRVVDNPPVADNNSNILLDDFALVVVPEPATWLAAILTAGLCGVSIARVRRSA